MSTSSFIVNLFILKDILSTINILCQMLQEKNATLGKAAILIKGVLQTFENDKSTLAFNNLWLEIQDFAKDYNINFNVPFQTQRLKQIKREPNRLIDFVLTTATGAEEPNEVDNATAEHYFRVNAYFKVLDSIIVNMKKRFCTESLEMAESIDNFFKLNIEKSKFFIDHYKDLLDVNCYNLKSEITVVKNYLTLTTGKDDISLEDLKTFIVKNVYPNIYKLLQVALTLPISSATCERSFSAMRRIKTWMRSTMVENRFNDLSILNIEKDLAKKINNNDIVNAFSNKNRYIVLK
uniref:Zinc finger MYM-type protein 1 n=1 Tax=Melanaphis sacchari TaxID=742174 RepID=A0A2H8TJR3_9HEMI